MPTIKLGTVSVVINRCYGGFSLSRAVYDWLKEQKSELVAGPTAPDQIHVTCGKEYWSPDDTRFPSFRTHPDLVAAVRALGDAANGFCSKLDIEDVALEIEIVDYDGIERVVHR
jgi:hypothetical protein